MSLTAHTAVTRRLTVEAGSGRLRRTAADVPGPLLEALGHHRTDRLPARTVLYVGGFEPSEAPPPDHRGLPVRTLATPGQALRLAHLELQAKTTDLALLATLDNPITGTVTVQVLRRAAEAVAEGPVVGALDLTGLGPWPSSPLDPEHSVVLRPLRHGGPVGDPDRHRLLVWSGRDEADERQVRHELHTLLEGLQPQGFPALPTAVPYGRAFGPVRAAAVTTARQAPAAVEAARAATTGRPRPVALLFPGQGSQHTAMAAGLYGHEPVFTAAVDAVLDLFGDEGPAVRTDWLGDRPAIPIDDVRAPSRCSSRSTTHSAGWCSAGACVRRRCWATAPGSWSRRHWPEWCRCPTRSP
ncbi:hypothetical protein [Peterkaempfera sp. SMS 1(5)a]|uniref:hypothetical protein n=1 Tax=Peterkaempfera podocarpi TaxID=3232308 RepID=UPI0036711ACC